MWKQLCNPGSSRLHKTYDLDTVTCTRYKWGPDSKLHFYRCTRTWHKCQKTGGNSLLLLNAITYYYTTAGLESWMTFHSLQYSCLSITYSSPEINICWSSYAEWLTMTCLSSNGHLFLLVLFYLHLVAPCTSLWIGFRHSAHHKENAPLISLAF